MSSEEKSEKIEITPEMLEAGFKAWRSLDFDDLIEWKIVEIYSAMESARRYQPTSFA